MRRGLIPAISKSLTCPTLGFVGEEVFEVGGHKDFPSDTYGRGISGIFESKVDPGICLPPSIQEIREQRCFRIKVREHPG
jgi:hypothetical protein